jgi:hypothetical protein
MQAAAVDLLTTDNFSSDISDRRVADSVRESFSKFVQGRPLNELADQPNHGPKFYLRVWWVTEANFKSLDTSPDQVLSLCFKSPTQPTQQQKPGPSKVALQTQPDKETRAISRARESGAV